MEERKDIKGYEGLYQVSNLGNVKSLDRYINSAYGSKQLKKGRILTKQIMSNGYEKTELAKDGKIKRFRTHRLVAETFIPNPENKEQVNHKNGIKTDNRVENLEWSTSSENMKHCYNILGRKNHGAKYGKSSNSKKVYQYTKDGKFVREYESVSKAGYILGINSNSIAQCARGKLITSGGYKWSYL